MSKKLSIIDITYLIWKIINKNWFQNNDRIFSEYGPTSISLTFSIIQSSKPVIVIQNIKKSEIESLEVESLEVESLEVETLEQSKISAWVHDIFVWYADETISENDLLFTIKYLIPEEIISVD